MLTIEGAVWDWEHIERCFMVCYIEKVVIQLKKSEVPSLSPSRRTLWDSLPGKRKEVTFCGCNGRSFTTVYLNSVYL